MEILNICLCGPVTDNWNYQDNLLAKYHKKLGNTVTIITSKWIYNKSGALTFFDKSHYINDDGVRMIRLGIKGRNNFNKKIKRYKYLYDSISDSNPDIIFIHGCQFIDIKHVVKYVKRHPNVRVYVDNHADLLNSASNWISKNILHRIIWKHCAKLIEPYTAMFWGVLPARVDFLLDMYSLPKEKVSLLVMGADDEKVEEAKDENLRKLIRQKYDIDEDDFLIITGGKLDKNKPQTLQLMQAVKSLKFDKVKLLVFGSVSPEYKEAFANLLCDTVKYIGWVDSKETYKYFNAADLVVFPGLHSVFWEQVVGLGKPSVFKYIEGFTHIDLGGNCKFLYNDSSDEIKEVLNEIINNNHLYENMKRISLIKGMEEFSYNKIAQKSIS